MAEIVPPADATGQDDELMEPLFPPRPDVEDDEIDITPMIDMTFLLLIYFLLVTTPDVRTAIELPQARHGGAVSQRNATIITIGEASGGTAPIYMADGTIASALVTGEPREQRETIAEHVRQGLQDESRTDVVIKADRHVPHREVARVMRAASLVDGIRLHLAVLQPLDE